MENNKVVINGEMFIDINGKLFKLIPNDQPFSTTEEQKEKLNKKRMLYKSKVEYYMITHRVGRSEAMDAIERLGLLDKDED